MLKTILGISIAFMGATAHSTEVTVLHTQEQVVMTYAKAGYTFRYMNIDALQNSIQSINSRLPANEQQARKIAGEMVRRHKRNLENGMRGVSLVSKWDIKKVPAIVFGNGEAVYYGFDVEMAIETWEQKK